MVRLTDCCCMTEILLLSNKNPTQTKQITRQLYRSIILNQLSYSKLLAKNMDFYEFQKTAYWVNSNVLQFFYSFGLFCLFKVISMFIKGGMICERKCEMPPPQRKSPDQLVHTSLLLQIEAILSSDHLTSPSRIGHPSHQMTDYHTVNPLYNVDIGPQ